MRDVRASRNLKTYDNLLLPTELTLLFRFQSVDGSRFVGIGRKKNDVAYVDKN